MASLLAFSATLPPQPLPWRATYVGAKAYLVAFTQALGGELAGTGVRAQVCCPGLVATDFHAGMDMSGIHFPVMEPSEVVDARKGGWVRWVRAGPRRHRPPRSAERSPNGPPPHRVGLQNGRALPPPWLTS